MEFSTKTPHLVPADLPNTCSTFRKCVGNMKTKFSLTELLKERIILIVRGRAKGNPQTARKTRRKQVPNGREDDPQAGSRVRNR
jgi:hypothetical protein